MPLLGVDQRLVDSTLIKTMVPLADARPIYLLVGYRWQPGRNQK